MMEETKCAWEEAYMAAILETDNAKLPERVAKAHEAIASRQRELASNHGGTPDEQQALSEALHGLAVLKKERIERCLGVNANFGDANQNTDGGNQAVG